MSPVASILVADHPASFDAFRRALGDAFSLRHVRTFDDAKAAMLDAPALVVCGCDFDDGRMYDVLRFLKAAPGLGSVPFLAVRCLEGDLLNDALYESVKIAVRALGGDAFVDLLRWHRRLGPAQASDRLVRLVEALAAGLDAPA